MLFASRYSDLCYGYNAFRRECVAAFALPTAHGTSVAQWGDGFEIETMINVRVAVAGKVIAEVPSFEYERRFGVSNLNTFRDGFRVLGTIISERRRGRRAPAAVDLTSAVPVQREERLDLTSRATDSELLTSAA